MDPRTRRFVTLAVLVSLVVVVVVAALAQGSRAAAGASRPQVDGWSTACRLSDARLTEISGMTYSQRHAGVVYLHNDSSGGPYLYAVSTTTCRTLARLTLAGAAARDLEAIGSGRDARGRPVLWVGDIGDNLDSWSHVTLLRVREPEVLRDQVLRTRSFRFTYPDRPHNAEALLTDPGSRRVWVVTRQSAVGGIYRVRPRAGRTVVAQRVGRAGAYVTDGSVSPDGSRFVLRDYVDALVHPGLPPGGSPTRVYLPLQLQGEAITWAPDGRSLLVASERDDRLLRIDPGLAAAPVTRGIR